MPTFYSLEDVNRYGIPTKIDGGDLTFTQSKVLIGMVGKVWVEGMRLKEAIEIALPAFRLTYELKDEQWISKKMIVIAGKAIRNKFFDGGDMGRVKRNKFEAGKRNNKKDKESIKQIIKNALSQLGNDTDSVLIDLGLKVAK